MNSSEGSTRQAMCSAWVGLLQLSLSEQIHLLLGKIRVPQCVDESVIG